MSGPIERPDLPEDVDLFQTFGPGFDRFDFPGPVCRVTGGHGGEALLICGSEKTALLDCGMAYCGPTTADNAKKVLAGMGRDLDMIFLSHSHYDHIGALPWLKKAFPGAQVLASRHCAGILSRPNARKLMGALGQEAKDLYAPDSPVEIITEGLAVDRIIEDGETVSLGEEKVTALATPGHTDCSMSYCLQPAGILFTSESTGILEGKDYVHTPCLKSFVQAVNVSMPKCRAANPRYLCLPHFGMVPGDYTDRYWEMFREECKSKTRFVDGMCREGLDREAMLDAYIERYWTPAKAMEQPKEAFRLNSGYILDTLLREREELLAWADA
ncbi:MAG: MBL fold metallo-hydrolase [Firmicutes bacterium]|nr:MBL fold metallo-hydrolase [Bacillota bacterium]